MRSILVLCFIAFAQSAPQYNYQAPPSFAPGGLGGFSSSSIGGYSGGGYSGGGYSSGPQAPIITKHFYIHSAPEDNDNAGLTRTIQLGPPRKSYRVVFIKAPASSAGNGRISVAAPQNEEKTVIYVLTKKSDLDDIQTDVQESHSVPTKPEVFFIKYKTQEEALHAQQQIQAQYDSLGGSSQITNEGVAPITSVIGSVGGGGAGSASSHTGSNAYLPPN